MIPTPGADGSPGRTPGLVVAFTSAISGVGRTSAVANVAWILAAAGRRVLVADWSTESAAVHEFLAPFHVGTSPLPAPVQQAVSALRGAGWGGELLQQFSHVVAAGARRYELPERLGSIALVTRPRPDITARRHPPPGYDADVLSELRTALLSSYDYILIDGATGPDEDWVKGMARISDVVVSCFKVLQRAISDAALVARRVEREADRAIRFVVTPTQIDDRDPDRVARSRRMIQEEFAGLLGSGSVAEIPYHPDDAYDERLATLIDDPGTGGTLLRAYELMTEAITQGRVRGQRPMSAPVRARYRRLYGSGGPDEPPETMFVAYATEDRAWVDWLRGRLRPAGVELAKLSPGGDPGGRPVLVVGSANPLAGPVLEAAQAAVRRGSEIVAVRVAGAESGPVAGPAAGAELVPARTVDLAGLGEELAAVTLLSRLDLIAPPPGTARTRSGFPGDAAPARTSNLPTRNPSFVGRSDDLEALRDALTGADPATPYVLYGAAGVGKSEIAREYAHRFSLDYDVTWWVSAHSRRAVFAGLGRLAPSLDVPEAGDVADAVLAALSGRSGRGHAPRWLLIYDNADDLTELRGLLPRPGSGHVIVTSRTAGAGSRDGVTVVSAASADPEVEATTSSATAGPATDAVPEPEVMAEAVDLVESFAEDESVALLRRHAPQISSDAARAVATAVEHLPFSLRLAGSWLAETAAWLRDRGSSMWESLEWASAEFVARMERGRADRPEPADYPASAAACLAITYSSLEEDELGRLANRLLELCAFLSPQSVALWLLCSRPAMEQLIHLSMDGERVHKDGLVLHQVLWTAARFGLVEVDWGSHATLRMHRMLQALVRDRVDPETRRERQVAVLRALAANTPTDADLAVTSHQAVFAELQKHLIPSGALEEVDPHVRHWVVNQIRFLYVTGDDGAQREALERAEAVLERWTGDFGPDDELRMQLGGQVANLYRALGDRERALSLDEELLSRQRRVLGADHPRTLRSGRGRGGDLRALSRFSEALAEDETTWAGLRDALGDDHPETILAANSLALSAFLTGDHGFALSFQQETYERHRRLFGPDNPANLWYACNLGTYLRESGNYRDSARMLTDNIQRILNQYPERARDRLRAVKSLAVTERRRGNPQSAYDHSSVARKGYEQSLGADHPDTLSCVLSLAADRYALGDADGAAELARGCLRSFQRLLGDDHAFTWLCQVNLAIFLRGGGDVAGSRSMSQDALGGLRVGLGEQHPWTLAAAINHAGALAAGADHAGALDLDETTAADCREFLGGDHPYTKIVEANLDGGRRAARGMFLEAGLFERQAVDIDVPDT